MILNVGRNPAHQVRTRTTILICLVAVVALAAVVAYHYLLEQSLSDRRGPVHEFPVGEAPQFLEENLALTQAQTVLRLDGFMIDGWLPILDGRTMAPDGRADLYLARNLNNPKRGSLSFSNQQGEVVHVTVEVTTSNLVCQHWFGK